MFAAAPIVIVIQWMTSVAWGRAKERPAPPQNLPCAPSLGLLSRSPRPSQAPSGKTGPDSVINKWLPSSDRLNRNPTGPVLPSQVIVIHWMTFDAGRGHRACALSDRGCHPLDDIHGSGPGGREGAVVASRGWVRGGGRGAGAWAHEWRGRETVTQHKRRDPFINARAAAGRTGTRGPGAISCRPSRRLSRSARA